MDVHRQIELRYRLKGLARELPARMALVSLTPPPARPAGRTEPRKDDSFRELLAMKGEIKDSFSRARLGLRRLSDRLEDFGPHGAGPREPGPRPAPPPAVLPPAPPPPPPPPPFSGCEPERRARGEKPRYALLALLTAALALAGAYFLPMLGRPPVAAYPLPHQRAVGLCRGYGGRLFFADPQRRLLFTLSDADGQVRNAQPFPVQSLAGLVFDGNYFWSSGIRGIARHEASGQLLASKSFPEAGSAAGPLAWDGKYLWSASPGQGRMVKYLPGELLFLSGNYPLPPSLAAGFCAEGEALYAIEQYPPRLCSYRPDPDMRLTAAAPLGRFLPPGARVSAFTLDKDYLWLITETPQELRRVRREDLAFAGPAER